MSYLSAGCVCQALSQALDHNGEQLTAPCSAGSDLYLVDTVSGYEQDTFHKEITQTENHAESGQSKSQQFQADGCEYGRKSEWKGPRAGTSSMRWETERSVQQEKLWGKQAGICSEVILGHLGCNSRCSGNPREDLKRTHHGLISFLKGQQPTIRKCNTPRVEREGIPWQSSVGLHASSAGAQPPSPVRGLRSHKPHSVAKKKKE